MKAGLLKPDSDFVRDSVCRLRFMGTETVKLLSRGGDRDKTLLQKEAYWISYLQTVHTPQGFQWGATTVLFSLGFFMVYFSICCIYFLVSVSDQVLFYWYWPHYPALYLLLQSWVFWYHGVSCYAFLTASLALGASHPTVFSSAKASISWNWPTCCWAVIFLEKCFFTSVSARIFGSFTGTSCRLSRWLFFKHPHSPNL